MPDDQELQNTAVTRRRGRRQSDKEAQEATGAPIGAAVSPVEAAVVQASYEPAAPTSRRRGPRAKTAAAQTASAESASASGGGAIGIEGTETTDMSTASYSGEAAGHNAAQAAAPVAARTATRRRSAKSAAVSATTDAQIPAIEVARSEPNSGETFQGAATQGEAQRFAASADPSEAPPAKGRRGGRGRSAEKRAERAVETQPMLLAESAPPVPVSATNPTTAQETPGNEALESATRPQAGRPLRRRYNQAVPSEFGGGAMSPVTTGEGAPLAAQDAVNVTPAAQAPGYIGEQPSGAATGPAAAVTNAPTNASTNAPERGNWRGQYQQHQSGQRVAGQRLERGNAQPGGQPGQQQGGPQQGGPQRGAPGQASGQGMAARGGVPYSPGGRGVQRHNPQQGQQGYEQAAGQRMPYGSYQGYEPYPGNMGSGNGTTAHEQGQNGGQPSGRRGRGFTGANPAGGAYQGYPEQPGQRWQGNRNESGQPGQAGRPPASPAAYTDRGSRGGLPGRRTPLAPHDRRGGLPGRMGQQGRRGGAGQQTPPEGRYPSSFGRGAPVIAPNARTVEITGIFWAGGGQGLSAAEVLDNRTLQSLARANPEEARKLGLRSGDIVTARAAEERSGRKIVVGFDTVNGGPLEQARDRALFEQLTATFPDRRIKLEQGPRSPISTRVIDLFAPLGFGSRALIVAPPKTGKTTLIREAAEAVLNGYENAVVMAVLVGERPEEVTDLRSRLEPHGGQVIAASFDEETERHAWLVQVAVERAKRVAESGKDAFMVLDSLTRLARAENLATRGQGRTLSGGIDAQALDTGRRAFGAARNLEEGGSITILATCLVDTGSRQDDVVYEEFKGTGNMELHLSRELAQRRLFPAVDAVKSGTRREEMLLTPEELKAATALRRKLADIPAVQATEQLLKVMEQTTSNAQLIRALEASR